jgi:hypothetical protein
MQDLWTSEIRGTGVRSGSAVHILALGLPAIVFTLSDMRARMATSGTDEIDWLTKLRTRPPPEGVLSWKLLFGRPPSQTRG